MSGTRQGSEQEGPGFRFHTEYTIQSSPTITEGRPAIVRLIEFGDRDK